MNFNLNSLMLGWLSALALLWLVVSWSETDTSNTDNHQTHPVLPLGNTTPTMKTTALPSIQGSLFKNLVVAAEPLPTGTDRQYKPTHSRPEPLAVSMH